MKESNEFYIWKSDEVWASAAVFWGEKGGYITDVSKAKVFSKEDAIINYNCRHEFVPVAKEMLEDLIIHKVDHQLVSSQSKGDTEDFIVAKLGMWDGNDHYFIQEDGSLTTDVMKAKVFTKEDAKVKLFAATYFFISKDEAMKVARPTITRSKLNRRTMTTPYGIIKPKQRKNRVKNTHQCGSCGKFMSVESYYTQDMGCDNCL
jgi:hypothetical protein